MSPARDLQNVTFDLDLITWQNVDEKKKKNPNTKSAAKINKKKSTQR